MNVTVLLLYLQGIKSSSIADITACYSNKVPIVSCVVTRILLK